MHTNTTLPNSHNITQKSRRRLRRQFTCRDFFHKSITVRHFYQLVIAEDVRSPCCFHNTRSFLRLLFFLNEQYYFNLCTYLSGVQDTIQCVIYFDYFIINQHSSYFQKYIKQKSGEVSVFITKLTILLSQLACDRIESSTHCSITNRTSVTQCSHALYTL